MRRQGASNPEPAQGTSTAAFLALVRTGAAGSAVAIRLQVGQTGLGDGIGRLWGNRWGNTSHRLQPIPADLDLAKTA